MEHWQDRTRLLIGDEGINLLKSKHVLVVGLGGVGAYAAEQIARAGIGRMTIVDGDVVNVTNRNRQLLALESTLGRPKAEVMADRVIVDLNDDGSAQIAAAFNAEDIVSILKDLRGTDIPVTFQYLIDFAVEEAAKEGVTFTEDQVTRLETGFEHLCSLAKQVLADHNMGTLMDIDLSTNVLDVFARYYDNVTDYSLQISEEKKFGWAVPMGFYAADNGFTFNVSVPNYGWFNRLNASLKGKTKDECGEYWHLNELSDSTYEMLQQMAAEDKFITIGQVYKKYVDRFNDDLEEVYIYKKY